MNQKAKGYMCLLVISLCAIFLPATITDNSEVIFLGQFLGTFGAVISFFATVYAINKGE